MNDVGTIDTVSKRVRIYGKVQGVGFRFFTFQQAQTLGVTGWVRNRKDGSVEAQLEGPRPAVEALLVWLRHGQPPAEVEKIQVSDSAAKGYSAFQQEATC